jgi:ribonuclease P protein component
VSSSHSFTRQQRLCKPSEFKRVFDQPCKAADGYFIVLAKTNQLPHARLGLAIAKKRVKRAVARNRLKRLVRESFRHHPELLEGLDCVVLVKDNIEQIDNPRLFHSLSRLWQLISKRCKKS